MPHSTRAWFALSLLLLLGAALLHTAVLLGVTAVWAALVHLTLFGWVTAMIVAVNYHTMPVFTGRDFPHRGPLWAQLVALVAGLALAVASLLAALPALLVAGLALELLAGLLFTLNVALLLARGPRRALPPPPPPVPGQGAVDKVATRATSLAGACLPLVLLLLLGARTGVVSGAWWLAAEHLMALGWVMLMIVGVALHVLPRFSGRGTRGVAWARAQLGLHLAALAMIVLGLGLGWGGLFAAGGVTMSVAIGLFAWTIWPTLRAVAPRPTHHPHGEGGHQMSPLTIRCVKAAFVALAAGILLGAAFALDRALGAQLRPLHAELNLWGWTTLLIYGMGYHMLPRFCGRPLRRARLAELQSWLAIGGVAVASLGWLLSLPAPPAGRALLVAGGLAQLAAALIFALVGAELLRPIARPRKEHQ